MPIIEIFFDEDTYGRIMKFRPMYSDSIEDFINTALLGTLFSSDYLNNFTLKNENEPTISVLVNIDAEPYDMLKEKCNSNTDIVDYVKSSVIKYLAHMEIHIAFNVLIRKFCNDSENSPAGQGISIYQ